MKIELLLEALETQKPTNFEEIDLCYCARGIFRQETYKTAILINECSMNCFCAQILDDRIQRE